MKIIFATLIVISANIGQAKAEPINIVASCLCEVLDSSGNLLNLSSHDPYNFLNSEPYFRTNGIYQLKDNKCTYTNDGRLSMDCVIPAAYASLRAEGHCQEVAKAYGGYGQTFPGSCELQIID